MKYSKTGLALTERFEGCKLHAYQDIGGVWTIGWGHTAGVMKGMVWTQSRADDQLFKDMMCAEVAVNELVTCPLTQGEFDALVDFVYNIGTRAFAHSTMLKLLNQKKYQDAADEFVLWDHVGGKEVAGLLERRKAEQEEFNGGGDV